MTPELAQQLISRNEKLMFVRHEAGPYFLVTSMYDPERNDACHAIPSWTWVKDLKAFRVHYLDLKTLEAVAYTCGYKLEFEDQDALRRLKMAFLERRDIKAKVVMEVPAARPLRDYQNIGAYFMYKSRFVLNSDSMGAGKTAQAVGGVVLNKADGRPFKTLVLSPASVKGSWEREFDAVDPTLKTMILHSSLPKRVAQYELAPDMDVLIGSYESFMSDYEELSDPSIFKPDILIIDEAHRISNRSNKITQLLIGGRDKKKTFVKMALPHSIYLLTGTPISNKMEDVYSLLKLMDPHIFSWRGFVNRYCEEEQQQIWRKSKFGKARPLTFTKIVGYKNEDELKAKLSFYMIRRTKDQVLSELPPKVFQTIELEMGAEERKFYNKLKKDYKAEIRGQEIKVDTQLVWMTRAQQICDSLEILPGSKAKKSTKLDELVRILNAETKNRKVVIFTKYATMAKIIARELTHLKPILFHGGIDSDKRQPLIDAFQEDPKHRVFVATFGAGGVGVTLTAADMVILYDRHWSPAVNNQAADRCHRMGQKNSVLVVSLRYINSVEERVERVWLTKQTLIESMVGDEKVLAKLTRDELASLI